MEFFKSVLKVGLIGYLVYTQVRANLNWLPELGMLRLSQSALLMKDSIYRLGLRVGGLFLLVIAAFDYWYQRREFEESIKMSKDEIREELKQMEGDPPDPLQNPPAPAPDRFSTHDAGRSHGGCHRDQPDPLCNRHPLQP